VIVDRTAPIVLSVLQRLPTILGAQPIVLGSELTIAG